MRGSRVDVTIWRQQTGDVLCNRTELLNADDEDEVTCGDSSDVDAGGELHHH